MKILLIGAFSFVRLDTGGQPVKSRELYYALLSEYGEKSVNFIETKDWKRHPLSLFIKTLFKSLSSDIIIMLPAHNGLKFFSKFLYYIKKIFHKKIYYNVIGGWLESFLIENNKYEKYLKSFNCVFVETNTMKNALIKRGIDTIVVPNFKSLSISSMESVNDYNPPFKICIFSRITELKGIEDAIEAVRFVNINNIMVTLDLYGPIDVDFEEKFNHLISDNFNYVTYKGCVSPNESVNVLKNYFLLLFPTKYYTEGVPGTIIDAFFSGLPVIASRWLNYQDVVKEWKTGLGYNFNDVEDLKKVLSFALSNPKLIYEMKYNCLKEAELYRPEFAIGLMKKVIENEG